MQTTVALVKCATYAPELVQKSVFTALESSGWKPAPSSTILVKPNLLRAHALTCTHPAVVAASCQWLLDQGVQVVVADSPGFGRVLNVARSIGLVDALKPLGLTIQVMGKPQAIALPDGRAWGVSRLALDCDGILSLPKVKAHSQMRMTLAVKNLFGCVCGLRKAVAHTVQGQSIQLFTDSKWLYGLRSPRSPPWRTVSPPCM